MFREEDFNIDDFSGAPAGDADIYEESVPYYWIDPDISDDDFNTRNLYEEDHPWN